jgi:ArsR family transcriptional regulator, arsenate/arsenite/antimonite-responsive transcriptional repressor
MNLELSGCEMALLFKALGDPTRLGIFQMLRCCAAEGGEVEVDEEGLVRPAGSLSVGEVCCRIGGSGSTISHHLKELRLAGLIRMEKRGRWIYCSVRSEAIKLIGEFVNGAADSSTLESAVCCPGPELAAAQP